MAKSPRPEASAQAEELATLQGALQEEQRARAEAEQRARAGADMARELEEAAARVAELEAVVQ